MGVPLEVICNLRVNANGYVIYVQGEQQWTENGALSEEYVYQTQQGPSQAVRFNTINYYPLLPEAQKSIILLSEQLSMKNEVITTFVNANAEYVSDSMVHYNLKKYFRDHLTGHVDKKSFPFVDEILSIKAQGAIFFQHA